ncbi:MAG: MerR family transcriptional regulator [Gammaproteobacteria bacterium]|nr:MerR family transcriptional regulator [Gammaproteobacteria bacterium]
MLDPGGFELPPIPTKRYFTIGEVSKLCVVKPHVLRYWEQEFPQLKPVKRRGNRRYYQRHEVKLIRTIRKLLYVEGFTISGARTRLEQLSAEQDTVVVSNTSTSGQEVSKMISQLISELNEVSDILT